MVIVAVNIIGGLATGLLQEGLSISAAFQKFTLLSVGEGLLSQIPALLNALAAGMVVTRVTREGGVSLAHEMVSQLGQFNRVKIVAGVAALGLSFLPGMPAGVLLTVAVSLFVFAGMHQAIVHQEDKAQKVRFMPRAVPLLSISVPISNPIPHLSESLESVRQLIFEKWGILLSPVQLMFSDSDDIKLLFRGVLVKEFITQDGIVDEIKRELIKLVDRSPEEFLDDVAVRRIIDFHETHSFDGVRRLVPDEIPFSRVTQVCRFLLSEKIPLKHIDLILQAISEHGRRDMQARDLLEHVRLGLRRVLCYGMLQGKNAP